MHDLLQQMGWEFIRKEKELGKRSRLWRHRDALRVLQENMGTGVVEGIFLTSPGDEEIEIDPFVNMKNMRLLKICNVKFSESHDYYFSRDLSLLEWHGYPCKSMMSSFQLERLVELIMPDSRLEQLWQETRRLENLVLVNLSYCKELTKTPDFNFVPNLETLILEGCESLAELNPSIGRLEHLALLNLKGCRQLTSLPKSISLESLATLILSDCSNLMEFPEIEGDMTKLSELHLDGTAIKELPTSINLLTGLILLNLENCKKLLSLRSGILPGMKSLKTFCLSGCESMDQLPEDLGKLENLEWLVVKGTAIRTLPSSIVHLKHLKALSIRGCGFVQLPDEIGLLSSLQELDLGENSFSSIPTSISKLSELKRLSLSKCSKLQSLPKHLPINLLYVDARDCPMLTGYSDTEMTVWTSNKGFHFIDCRNSSNIDEDCTYDTPLPMHNEQVDLLFPQYIKKLVSDGSLFEIRFPCTAIPLWCQNWDTRSPIKIELSGKDHEDSGQKTKGFAFAVVFVIKKHDNFDEAWQLKNIFCHVAINRHPVEKTICLANFKDFRVGSFGICCYVPHERFPWQLNASIHNIEVSFSTDRLDVELLKFGVHQVFEHDVEDFTKNLARSANDHLDLELNFSRHCKKIFDGANKLAESGNITSVKHKIRQGESSLRVPQNGVQSNRTAWDNIPTIEHKCYINGTYELLSELFQGYVARHSPFQFVLPFPILSPWFFHHSVGNTAVCYLPPNICNDERWLGLELYVHCGRLGFYPGEIVLDVDLYAHGKHPLPIYSCQHKTRNGNFIAIHVPREYFSKELNDCEGISAIFEPTTPNVEVKMCGTRLLYVQDSKLLSKGIIESIFGRPDLLLYLNKTVKGFLQKDKSDGDWCSRMTTREPRKRVVLKSSQKLLTCTEQVAKEVSTLLNKHRKEYHVESGAVDEADESGAVDEADSFVVHSKQSFFENWDLIQQDTCRNLSGTFNHLHIIAETLLHRRDSKKLVKTLEDLLREFFKHRVLVTLSLKGHIVFVLGHFDPFSLYNLCFPQKGIPEWFDHQCNRSMVGIELPPNLYDNKSWRGLVFCVAFSIKEHPVTFSKASFRLLCHLESEENCLNPVAHCSISKDKIKWVHLRGFIWLTYIPRVVLTELDGKRIVVARVYNYCPGLIVDKCGIRLLYQKDVEGLKKTITECCTSFVKDLESIDQFLESEDYEDLPSDDQTL